ncbi:MAG TPA: threonine synthase [Gemmatimonadales bacterium]|nr:threonine synthase [Gemmatimonadales bacterium]
MDWLLCCSGCSATRAPDGLPSVCGACGQPWLVSYPARALARADRGGLDTHYGTLRFRRFLPLGPDEQPVSLGEGGTPLLRLARTGRGLGLERLWLKDEAANPTGSFKARGLMMAVTRAVAAGAESFVLPTAGNAGVAASAYGARAGRRVKVFAPAATPKVIVAQMRGYGADLELIDGHIGDCGRLAIAHAERTGATLLATLREPYRIEGKKTLGYEIAEQLGWTLPDAVVYPAGGGTGLIAMWIAFRELLEAGWVAGRAPRLYAVQSAGCAPVVRAVQSGMDRCEPWPDPWTIASGLRVPSPLGGALMLRAIRDTGGGAVAVSDAALAEQARAAAGREGVDFCPEGGATLAGAAELRARGDVRPDEQVVVLNTGAGWLYR